MSDQKQQQISLIATNVAGQTIAMANTLPALLRAIVRHYSDHEAITIHDDGERITWAFRGKPQPQQWPSRQKHPRWRIAGAGHGNGAPPSGEALPATRIVLRLPSKGTFIITD